MQRLHNDCCCNIVALDSCTPCARTPSRAQTLLYTRQLSKCSLRHLCSVRRFATHAASLVNVHESVQAVLAANNCSNAFQLGQVKPRDLQGLQPIFVLARRHLCCRERAQGVELPGQTYLVVCMNCSKSKNSPSVSFPLCRGAHGLSGAAVPSCLRLTLRRSHRTLPEAPADSESIPTRSPRSVLTLHYVNCFE